MRKANGLLTSKEVEEAPMVLSVKDCDGQVVQLECLPPNMARCTLGIHLSPDGNNVNEIKYLHSIAEKWKAHICTRHLQHHEAWYALLMVTVMKTIEYPLLALTLTAQECAHVYAPNKFMGLGLPNIFITMGLLHIELLSCEGQLDSITGGLLHASIEATKALCIIQLWLGCNIPN